MHTAKRGSAASRYEIAASSCAREWLHKVLPGRYPIAPATQAAKRGRSRSEIPILELYTLFFAILGFGGGTVRCSRLPSVHVNPPRPLVRARERATPAPRRVGDGRGSATQVDEAMAGV